MSIPLAWALKIIWSGWLQRTVASHLSSFIPLCQIGEQSRFLIAQCRIPRSHQELASLGSNLGQDYDSRSTQKDGSMYGAIADFCALAPVFGF